MPLYTFVCTYGVEPCSHTEDVICSFEQAQATLSNGGYIKHDFGDEPECRRCGLYGPDYATEFKDNEDVPSCVHASCPVHAHPLVWRGVESTTIDRRMNGNNSGRFQTQAVLANGQKVPGHFGKTAKNKNRAAKKIPIVVKR